MSERSRDKITTFFLFLLMALNLVGFIVREYLIITSPDEETRWLTYLFAGAHLAIAVCAFMIWRGKQNALYALISIALLVIILDVGYIFIDPTHHPSIPDIILAFSESVILLILLRPSLTRDGNL